MATKKTPISKKSTGLTDDQILTALKVNHPQWSQWIIQNPELKKVIIAWAKIPGGPTQEQIDAAVYPTKLVQEYNANQQYLDKLKALSPGDYKFQMDQAQKEVNDLIAKSGNTLDEATKTAIFNQHFYQGIPLTDSSITKELGSGYKSTNATSGSALSFSDQVKSIASNYMMPITSDVLNKWAGALQSGTATTDDITKYFKDQAAGQYQFMAGSIDHITPSDWFAPAKTLISNNLDIPTSQIDFNDPSGKWMGLVTTKDPKTGATIARSNSDIIKEMRTNPVYGYDNTQGAKDSAFQLGSQIRSMMGYGA